MGVCGQNHAKHGKRFFWKSQNILKLGNHICVMRDI